jgi:uncharacterized protein (DUF983 family)
MKVELGNGGTRNERKGIEGLKAEIWKLKGIRRGCDEGRCPLCCEGRKMLNTYYKSVRK